MNTSKAIIYKFPAVRSKRTVMKIATVIGYIMFMALTFTAVVTVCKYINQIATTLG